MKTIKDLTNITNVEDTDLFIVRKNNQDLNISFKQIKNNLGISENCIQTTYQELVTLKTDSELVPGCWYRITDYQCTTTQVNTSSANHQFDILILATSNNELSEECKTIKHEGDTYFQNSNLNAWKIWYSLENDPHRFLWADEANGKGVIYRMIDEFNNDCPYDFKNILFNADNPDYGNYNCYTFTSIYNANNNVCDTIIVLTNYSSDDNIDISNDNKILDSSDIVYLDDICYEVKKLPFVIFFDSINPNTGGRDDNGKHQGPRFNYIGHNSTNIILGQKSYKINISNEISNIIIYDKSGIDIIYNDGLKIYKENDIVYYE